MLGQACTTGPLSFTGIKTLYIYISDDHDRRIECTISLVSASHDLGNPKLSAVTDLGIKK